MARRTNHGTRRPRRRTWVWPASLLTVLLLAGYVAADLADVVPGPLTTAPHYPPPEPYPTLPAVAQPVPEVPGPDAAAPLPGTGSLQGFTTALQTVPQVGPEVGVLVVDVLERTEILATRADDALIPASATKLLTAAAAIATAGPEHRFVTRVVHGAEGQVVLVAGGDLALAAGEGDPEAVVGHAGLGDLAAAAAEALTAGGRTEVELLLDVDYFQGPALAPRWDADDLAAGDAMNMAPMAIEMGTVEGSRARATDPAGAAGATFAAALRAEGIEVSGTPTIGSAPEGATELASVSSARLDELAAVMLQRSENILAEGIGRLVAHETGLEPSFSGGGEAIAAVLSERGIDVTGLDLHDSAGLSSTNRISPRTLVQTLLDVADSPSLGSVARGLPVAGLEGTLSARLQDSAATGVVSAKTGTLFTVVTLTGYVTTQDGRLLAFAVMADQVPRGSVGAGRQAVDEWIETLAACGCPD